MDTEIFSTEELIVEILIRLPTRSIGRCRCVCKRWKSIATDPSFILVHASRAPASTLFFPDQRYLSISDFRIHWLSLPLRLSSLSRRTVRGASNGFLLLLERRPYGPWCYLYNPTTKEHPPPVPVPDGVRRPSLALAFVRTPRSPHFVIAGLGQEHGCHLYSFRTRDWKLIATAGTLRPTKLAFRSGVSCEGRIVWEANYDGSGLACLDVEAEKFTIIPLPAGETHLGYIGESRGVLHFVGQLAPHINSRNIMRGYDIWEMKPGSWGAWSPLLRLVPEVFWGRKARRPSVAYFYRGEEEEEGEDQLILGLPAGLVPFLSEAGLVSYHLRDGTLTTLCAFPGCDHLFFPLAETLTSLLIVGLDYETSE